MTIEEIIKKGISIDDVIKTFKLEEQNNKSKSKCHAEGKWSADGKTWSGSNGSGGNFTFLQNAKLNTERCQDTVGKTEKMLRYIGNKYYTNYTSNNEHNIVFVITENSLLQTEAWCDRTRAKFELEKSNKRINIDILSSDKASRWKNITHFIGDITTTDMESEKGRNSLPHIVIMCCHQRRVVHDIELLLKHFIENCQYNHTKFKFNFVFDEADERRTIPYIGKFIETIEHYSKKSQLNTEKIRKIIGEVTFITATPRDLLLKLKHEYKINALENIDKMLDIKREWLTQNYRSYKDHDIYTFESNYPNNPIEYVREAILNIPNLLYTDKPNILFVPCKRTQKSHEQMRLAFKDIFPDYSQIIINGKTKGFFENNIYTSFDDYKKKHNIQGGELRDILRHWKKQNPNTNLIITGGQLLKRGLTFNTDGFNFTHLFLCKYHLNDIAGALQTLGRSSGNKKYADICRIILPEELDYIATKNDDMMVELKEKNIEIYTAEDFEIPDYKNKNSNLIQYTLHYRKFERVDDMSICEIYENAKKYHDHLKNSSLFNNKKVIKRRTKKSNTGKDFYTDNLNENKSKIRSVDEINQRLTKPLERPFVKNGEVKIARTGWCWGYSTPPIYNSNNELVGGDNETLKIYIPILVNENYILDDEDTLSNNLHPKVSKFLENLDKYFKCEKGTIISTRHKK
jgi:hypothetical protein